MRNFKKNLIAGILSGALIFSGGQALANPAEMSEQNQNWHEEEVAHKDGWAKYFSERYGINSVQIEQALNDGIHIKDIKTAAVLAKISGKNFSDVLAMKVGWIQVAEKLGITHEQIKNFYEQKRDEHFAKMTGLDVKTIQNLLKDGYNPRDIDIAAKIAKATNKDVKNVLGKRKINNTWDDVAKSFGVDMKKIMPPPGHHNQRRR